MTLISLILEQYRGVFERIYIFSPSIDIDDGKYIEQDLGVNTERVGRGGAAPHHPAAAQDHGGVKEVGDEETVSGPDNLRRPSGCASAPQTQRRPGYAVHQGPSYADQHLVSAAVRVNQQFLCCWRLRNQHELDAVVEELSALLPKEQLYQLYEQATRKPYSFLFVCYLKPRNEMFYKRFEERFALEREADGRRSASWARSCSLVPH